MLWALQGRLGPVRQVGSLGAEAAIARPTPTLPPMPETLREHAEFAAERLARLPVEISGMMSKHQLALADRQCRMSELSQRVQDW